MIKEPEQLSFVVIILSMTGETLNLSKYWFFLNNFIVLFYKTYGVGMRILCQ